jgi:hypothetical protein
MLRASLFWGLMLIVVGLLLGMQAAGLITGSVWGYLWGVFLLGAGIWMISSAYYNPKKHRAGKGVSVNRNEATRANLRFEYGAGALVVRGGAPGDKVLEGSAGAGMDLHVEYVADEARVKISNGPSWIPFLGPDEGAWVYQLNEEIPIEIRVSSGASTADFDLTGVKLQSIRFETGASTVKLVLPSGMGQTRVEMQGGASSFDVTVPQGVEALVKIEQGASAINIDEARFPQVAAGRYQSGGYESAKSRVEMLLNAGAAKISIR